MSFEETDRPTPSGEPRTGGRGGAGRLLRIAPILVFAIGAGASSCALVLQLDERHPWTDPPPDAQATNDAPSAGAAAGDADAEEGPETSPVDAGGTTDVKGCTFPTGGDLCTKLFPLSAPQIVDGKPDEFCDVPSTTFRASEGAFQQPTGTTGLDHTVTVRAAYTNSELHVHVHVVDSSIVVSGGDDLWNGDSVSLFITAQGAPGDQDGNFTGTNDSGAVQLIIAPPATASGAPRARAFYSFNRSVLVNNDKIFAARWVNDGYDVEVRWSFVLGSSVAKGATIAFDVGVNIKDSPAAAGVQLQSVYGLYKPVPASSPCGGPAQPSCDDRTWCRPTLQ